MDPSRLERMRRLFEEACALEATERAAFLIEACPDDAELRAEIDALLRADGAAVSGDPLAEVVGAAALGLEAVEGDRIGAYRVLGEVGRGGMGRVFRAERADGEFDQVVALKLLTVALASPQLVERFRQERQILARLQHPNIARLLDGGVTDTGQPFFALEYVDGVPIDRYCDAQRLAVEERLSLFQDVCRAVVYAHANLVVHRDLKPANIMTTEDGQVRLLDFGIAKVLADDEDAPTATRTGLVALTPAYASPEQVRGDPVGTATDVYSLGVILYELLTGTRPYDLPTQRPTEVERVVTEVEPDRPSTRVARHATREPESATWIVGARSTDPGRLRRRLSGDLDVVCMKALRKEPGERYGSVEAMADDIQRHLDGRPILARPATIGYRLGKGVRRHRWAVGAAAAVVLSSSALVAFYTARLQDERDLAQLEAAKAREVADFLQGLFEVSDPSESLGETITARELLDEGAIRIDSLGEQPEVQANMLRVIGEVYVGLGLPGRAAPLLERAVALNRELYGEAHEDLGLSQVALAIAIQDVGDISAAEAHFRDAIDTFTRTFGPEHPRVAEAIEQFALWLETDGRYELAEEQYHVALERLRASLPSDDERVLSVVAKLGNLLRQLGRLEEAEPLLREALERQRVIYGERHPDVAGTARELAALLRDQDRFEESEALYEDVLSIRREILGDFHQEVANTLNSYAILLDRMGEPERALDAYREFVGILDRIHDRPHPNQAAGYHNLALSLRDAGRLDESRDFFLRSIELQDVVFRAGHPNRAFPRVGLASVYREMGTPERGEPLLREALAVRREGLPEGHRYIGESLSELAETLMDQGRLEEAQPLLLEADEILMADGGPEATRTRTNRRRLVRLYQEMGHPDLADRYRAEPGG